MISVESFIEIVLEQLDAVTDDERDGTLRPAKEWIKLLSREVLAACEDEDALDNDDAETLPEGFHFEDR